MTFPLLLAGLVAVATIAGWPLGGWFPDSWILFRKEVQLPAEAGCPGD